MARVTLSTIVISAVCAVLDRGFRSNVIIFFFAFFKAIVLSPSSNGTKTTSAEKIPFLSTFLLALSIFILVISPTLIQRYDQFGDPLYFSQSNTIFLENYVSVVAENTDMENYSASDYIEDNGILSFFNKFILNGTTIILTS